MPKRLVYVLLGLLGATVEKRKTVRYRLSLPVLFSWIDRVGKRQKEGGFTRNVSTSGVYVNSATSPALGAAVELEVVLPLARNRSSPLARLRASGTVVRCGALAEGQGFAAFAHLEPLSGVNDHAAAHEK